MASSSSTPQTTDASHPFDRPTADVVLRSCDLVDFRVHSRILTEASPFFSDMFELPQPPGAEPNTTSGAHALPPVVDMAEDAETLDLLLRLLYPIAKPPLEEPRLLALVLKAATKYDMVWPATVVLAGLRAITPHKASQVWAAACRVRTDLEGVARQAALALRASELDIGGNFVFEALYELMEDLDDDLTGISAGDYFRLKQFLRAPQPDIDAGRFALLSPPPEAMASAPSISPPSFSTDLPSPDVICRSLPQRGTGLEQSFEAHSLILSLHSPVLKTRLGPAGDNILAPSEEKPSSGALAVLEFDEDAVIVSLLLKACYDGEEGLPADLELGTIAELSRASQKYEMTRIALYIGAAWDRTALRRPLEAYLVAMDRGLHESAKAAAKNVLTGPVADDYTILMESTPAMTYHFLLVYYDDCCAVRREHFSAAGNRMPGEIYTRRWASTVSVKKAINQVGDGAHGAPPRGGPKDALLNFLVNKLSADAELVPSELWTFSRTLMECVTSVPDAVEAAIDDVRSLSSILCIHS